MQQAKAGPSRIPHQDTLGVSFKDTVDTLASFREPRALHALTAVEIVIHTIICIRGVYPPNTFTRRRAHGVAVYQSRHPEVRSYVAQVVAALQKEMERGTLRRTTVIIRAVDTGLPLERFIIDFGYMNLGGMQGPQGEAKIQNAPSPDDLSLALRGFLIRLAALDGQLLDCKGETTFAVIVETEDDLEPQRNDDGTPSPWVPALAGDTLNSSSALTGHDPEPLLSVRAVETGVIDLRMVVQECTAKTGVEHLQV